MSQAKETAGDRLYGRAAVLARHEMPGVVAFGVWDRTDYGSVYFAPEEVRRCANGCATRLRASNPSKLCSLCLDREWERDAQWGVRDRGFRAKARGNE